MINVKKDHFKNILVNYLENNADILSMDKEKKESFKAHFTKNTEEQFVIFDETHSIELKFEEENFARFLELKYTGFKISDQVGSNIHIKSFAIEVSSEPDLLKSLFIYKVRLIVEDFEFVPANSKKYQLPKNINYDLEVHFKLAAYFHEKNKVSIA
jgi:hypothetical protein